MLRGLAIFFALLGNSLAIAREPAALNVPAPELAGITSWINAEPLKLADLKGKVVVLHFWTHGCINCIHNYPHMKAWHEQFSDKGAIVLGIHTPEFDMEMSLDRIKKKVKDNELKFPIAIDNQGKTWAAWENRWWPSVYLIDKKGVVRYGWAGELNSKNVQGERAMRTKIEELLREEK